MRPIKGVVFLLALFLISVRAAAQVPAAAPSGAIGQTEIQLAQWAVTQGGLVLVVLVVIWSYRRDFHRIFQAESERTQALLSTVQASTAALTMHAEAMRDRSSSDREHAAAYRELALSVQKCEVAREVLDKQGRLKDERGR
jgi:hypothetical protein